MQTKKIVILFSFLFFCQYSGAQVNNIIVDGTLDRLASNVGGKIEFKRVFTEQMIYPEKSFKDKIGGKVELKFMVKADGHIADLKVVKSVNTEVDAEAIRIFRLLLWKPALYKKEAVNTYSTLAFEFNPKKYEALHARKTYTKINTDLSVDTSYVIYEKTDEPPVYPEGSFALQDFVRRNLEYPKQAQLQNIQGVVLLSFIIEPNGLMSNIDVEKSVGVGCDEEAVRVLKMIKWKAGIKSGKQVRVKQSMPIVFKLNNDFRDNSHSEQK